jgi:hypothetical protein
MKAASCLLLCLVSAASAAPLPDPTPVPHLVGASVTLPYSELRALWEAAADNVAGIAPEAAPVPFVLHQADVRIALGAGASRIEARFEVETLEKKWHRIPLLGGDVQLDTSDAGERHIVWDDGYTLLTNEPGKTAVTLHLVTRGSRHLTSPLALKLGTAAVKRFSVSGIPAGLEARVNGQIGESLEGSTVFLLPGGAAEISLELAAPKVEELPKPLPPITPSRWTTQSQVLVRFAEGRLHYSNRMSARAEDGSGLEITLLLPTNASGLKVSGDDLAEWTQTRSEDGRRLLRIQWKSRDILDREVTLLHSVPQSSLAEQWTLQTPRTANDGETRHLYAIIPADGLELKSDLLRTAVDSRRLPEWMRAEINGAVFVTAETNGELVLQTHWLPAVATAQAIVSESKASLRLVADGSTRTAISYTVRHQAPLAWRLELPKNVELLSCLVAGVTAEPIRREDGVIELPLPTPDQGATTVSFVYTSKLQPLDPVSGDVALELPLTPLFIEHLDWSIALPDIFEITAIDGNVSVAATTVEPTRGDRTVALRKDFCRAERPTVALFFQRRSLEN